jgi:hypothetical protein
VFLAERGYGNEFVESQFKRVRFLDRSALFKKVSKLEEKIIKVPLS